METGGMSVDLFMKRSSSRVPFCAYWGFLSFSMVSLGFWSLLVDECLCPSFDEEEYLQPLSSERESRRSFLLDGAYSNYVLVDFEHQVMPSADAELVRPSSWDISGSVACLRDVQFHTLFRGIFHFLAPFGRWMSVPVFGWRKLFEALVFSMGNVNMCFLRGVLFQFAFGRFGMLSDTWWRWRTSESLLLRSRGLQDSFGRRRSDEAHFGLSCKPYTPIFRNANFAPPRLSFWKNGEVSSPHLQMGQIWGLLV